METKPQPNKKCSSCKYWAASDFTKDNSEGYRHGICKEIIDKIEVYVRNDMPVEKIETKDTFSCSCWEVKIK